MNERQRIGCEEALRRLAAYLDRELDDRDARTLTFRPAAGSAATGQRLVPAWAALSPPG